MTSCSDHKAYRDFCKLAASDDDLFSVFRRNELYRQIVETVSKEQGDAYLSCAISKMPSCIAWLKEIGNHDCIGSPIVYQYGDIIVSPTTLRYINTAVDLITLFEDTSGFDVVEIGAGYGGLCRLLSIVAGFRSYTIIDLNEAIALARRFLGVFDVKNVRFIASDSLQSNEHFDLCISNYAFSELNYESQSRYLQDVLLKSSQGYMLCNCHTNTWDANQMTVEEVVGSIQNAGIMDSVMLSQVDIEYNVDLIVWRKNQ